MFCVVAPNTFSISTAVVFFYIQKCLSVHTHTKQKEPDNGDVHRSLKNCGSSLWSLFQLILLAHTELWMATEDLKISGPLTPRVNHDRKLY